ncbi:50S ribosomal protein L4 [Balneolaceae bacterium ANBcel3]|nr:50S ribosomal protein L4 [Balneolaceae bacterium ANBcel3]
MKLKVLNKDGSDSGREITLDDSIFGIEPNDQVIYEDVRSYLANQRRGTASTKGRSQVRGGGRKAYRQKGTGMARRGTIRSPLLKGGGTVFGPQPRDYVVRLTKKMRSLARKSALSYKAKDESVLIIEDFTFEEPKTKSFKDILKALNCDGKKVLLLTDGTQKSVYKSGRNIPRVSILESNKPATYQIMNADVVVIQESAVKSLENSLNRKAEEAEA